MAMASRAGRSPSSAIASPRCPARGGQPAEVPGAPRRAGGGRSPRGAPDPPRAEPRARPRGADNRGREIENRGKGLIADAAQDADGVAGAHLLRPLLEPLPVGP